MNRWTGTGTFALMVGVLMLGFTYASSGVAQAGQQVPCDATATATLAPVGQIQAAFQVAPCTATPTRSPSATATVKLKTLTPTPTSTPKPATATASSVAPTNTAAAAPTSPGSGNEGVAVRPPNTGSGGDGGSGGYSAWIIGMGLLLIILGSGAALVGVRQRR